MTKRPEGVRCGIARLGEGSDCDEVEDGANMFATSALEDDEDVCDDDRWSKSSDKLKSDATAALKVTKTYSYSFPRCRQHHQVFGAL